MGNGDMTGFASPPCFAHELAEQQGQSAVDPQTAVDVARWRKGERARLITARLAIPIDERVRLSRTIGNQLDELLSERDRSVVSVYWPFRGEPDLRPWMKTAHRHGWRVALPVVEAKATPLSFREWAPECRMERGVWIIPIPADGEELVPEIAIAPLVGVDPARYRLGYGGGFFDRTLASLSPRPFAIGVGYEVAQIGSIFPQWHDVPMEVVLIGR